MTKTEKRKFIKDCLKGLEKTLLDRLSHVPEGWDGHELRHWIADRAKSELAYVPLNKIRKADYENDVIVENL
jgi:hypothetical protein